MTFQKYWAIFKTQLLNNYVGLYPTTLAQLLTAALVLFILAVLVFHRGLRRYESGSAIQI